jgi:hypothetical protein
LLWLYRNVPFIIQRPIEFPVATVFLFLAYACVISAASGGVAEKVLLYRGASDASAAVAVGDNMFIVADDENNVLRVYRTDTGALPVQHYDLTDFLGIEPEHPEADIEGATMIGRRVYWITSHGRNRDGKIRLNRYRFFATDILIENGSIVIRPVGKPYRSLAHRLASSESMRYLGLDRATRFDAELKKKEREKLAPKEQGLNIEALCASADGKTLYIGFRNPRPFDKALVVPLKNADAIIKSSAKPVFGEPILWDLDGLGIRSMEYCRLLQAYLLVAGPHDEAWRFALYRWSGKLEQQPKLIRQLRSVKNDFAPEALIPFKGSNRFLLLSDDGTIPVKVSGQAECTQNKLNNDGTCPNKFLTDQSKKTFRAIWLKP